MEKVIIPQQPQEVEMKDIDRLEKPLFRSTIQESKKGDNPYAVAAALNVSLMQQISGIQVILLYTGDIVLRIWPSIEKTLPILMHTLGLMASFMTFWLMVTLPFFLVF